MAGDKFDEAIIKYIKRTYNVIIGDRAAEDLKINIGSVYPRSQKLEMDVKGRDVTTGLPINLTVNSDDLLEALYEPAMQV